MWELIATLLEKLGLAALSAWLHRSKVDNAIAAQNKVASLSDAELDERVRDEITRK